jgi:photosystem II stability/assembly factor-like uncharacterized protein
MHRHFYTSILAILGLALVVCTGNGQTTWKQVEGIQGASILGLARDSSGDYLAATASGVYSSADGAPWEPVAIPDVSVQGYMNSQVPILVTPAGTTVIAMNGNILRRAGGASAWSSTSLAATITGIAIDGSGSLYATTFGDGKDSAAIYRSTDDGSSWVASVNDAASTRPRIGNDITVMNSSIILVASDDGLYRSTDAGASWERINSATNFNHLFVTPGGAILANSHSDPRQPDIAYRTTDGGTSWSTRTLERDITGFSADHAQRLYAYSRSLEYYNISVSTDDGATWSDKFWVNGNAEKILPIPGNELMAGTSLGVYRSTDLGKSWRGASTGLHEVTINDLYTVPSGEIIAATRLHGLLHSTDNGMTWQDMGIASDNVGDVWGIIRTHEGTLLAGIHSFTALLRSTDNGTSWQSAGVSDPFDPQFRWSDLTMDSAGDIYLGTATGLSRSTDDGRTWNRLATSSTIGKVSSVIADTNGVIIVAGSRGILRSIDTGATWFQVAGGPGPGFLARGPGDTLYGVLNKQFVQKSGDDGATWETIASPLLWFPPVRSLLVTRSGLILAGMAGQALYSHPLNSGDWSSKDSYGIPPDSVTSLAQLPDGSLLAGTSNHGLFRSSGTLGLPVVPVASRSGNSIRIYSDPASGDLTLFGIPRGTGHVTLSIVNAIGQHVATLWDGTEAECPPQLSWHAASLPVGSYYCSIRDGLGGRAIPFAIVR